MPILVDEAVVVLLGETTALSKAAANKLQVDPHPHYDLIKAYSVKDKRKFINLESKFTDFNPHPSKPLPYSLEHGWPLQCHPFLVTQDGRLMMKWKNTPLRKIKIDFVTPACMATASTVSVFFSESEMIDVREELIDIVAPYSY